MKFRSQLWLVAAGIFAMALTLGCRKSNGRAARPAEAKITGDRSDPPVALHVNWQPGGRYVMRMEMKENSDSRQGRGPGRGSQQTTLAHEYAVTVTNAPAGGNRG